MLECDIADFIPAPSTVLNVAVGLTILLTVQHFTIRENIFTFAMNAFTNLSSSTKPEEVLVQVAQVPPIPTVQPPPTPTLQYQPEYQPESTSTIFCAVTLCIVFILVGVVFTLLRNRSTAKISSPSSRFNVGSANQKCASRSTVPPKNDGAKSESRNVSSKLKGDICGSRRLFTTTGTNDNSNKNAPAFLDKVKLFLILFVIFTTLTHGGQITRKLWSIRDNFTSSNNATATFTPYRPEIPAISVPEIAVDITTPSAIRPVKYTETPSSHFSPGLDEKYDSIFSAKKAMTPIPTSVYPNSLSLVTGSRTATSPSKLALDQAPEYVRLFIVFFLFFIIVPILSFVFFVLPHLIEIVKVWKSNPAAQREPETLAHAVDSQVMKVDTSKAVHAIEVAENSKVDINIIREEIVPALIDKGKGKALEVIEENENATVSCSVASQDIATPPKTNSYVVPSRYGNRRERRAWAAQERARNASNV